jgi:Uma2 family endonuclease
MKKKWTPEEYLAWERQQPEKHEFHGGDVFVVAGATFEHNQIVANVLGELRAALREKPCRVCASDLRVKIPATGLYTYPDASVVCGRPAFEDDKLDTLLNPLIIVEVLSESTEDYDRGTKFTNYRTIASLRDYVLISTDKVLVEYHTRRVTAGEVGSHLQRHHRYPGTHPVGSIAHLGAAVSHSEVRGSPARTGSAASPRW